MHSGTGQISRGTSFGQDTLAGRAARTPASPVRGEPASVREVAWRGRLDRKTCYSNYRAIHGVVDGVPRY